MEGGLIDFTVLFDNGGYYLLPFRALERHQSVLSITKPFAYRLQAATFNSYDDEAKQK
jgi:hypothetical protein